MKKTLFLLALSLVLAACNKTLRKTFHLTGFPNLEISYNGGYTIFGIEANEDDHWTLTSDADWFTVQQSFGNGDAVKGYDDAVFLVCAERWIMNSTRAGRITVTGPNGSFTKYISQPPKPVPAEILQLTGSIPCSGEEITVELPTGYWVKAETGMPWLTILNCEEGELTLKAEPNPSDEQERTAVVHIYLSDKTPLADVTITQEAGLSLAPVE